MSSEFSCEGSDEASENELLDRSLSVWRGWSVIEKEDFTPVPLDLHTACSIGQYDWVRAIMSRNEGASTVDKKNKGGWTALMYACYIGHDNIVSLLVKAGCQMNKMKNPRGHTPLMLAASCGNENVARTLVRNGAELEVMDKSGWTALFHATYAGHQNFVAFLLETGANINAVEPTTGLSPFMLAAAEGHEIIVQLFLQHGVTAHAKAYNGDMARSLALIKGYIKIVSLIDNHNMPASRLRSEPGLDFYLSSSDDDQPKQLRGLGVLGQKKNKGPSIRDGPDAIARMIDRTRPDEIPVCTDMLTPKGYMSFSNTGVDKGVAAPLLSHRDVTSPINPEDYKDTSGDVDDFGDDSNAFSKTGAITIKSSSSSSGGLVAALGLSREGSLDSDDSRGYDLSHPNMDEDSPECPDCCDNKDFGKNDSVGGTTDDTDTTSSGVIDHHSGRKKLPLLKLPESTSRAVVSSSSSSDSLKEKPRAVVSPLRDYFPLDVSFPPVAGGENRRETDPNHQRQLERPLAGGGGVEQRRHPLSDQTEASRFQSCPRQLQHQQQQYLPPRESMSQSDIVQAYFNSMGGGGSGGDGIAGSVVSSSASQQPEQCTTSSSNKDSGIASPGMVAGSMLHLQQQHQHQTSSSYQNEGRMMMMFQGGGGNVDSNNRNLGQGSHHHHHQSHHHHGSSTTATSTPAAAQDQNQPMLRRHEDGGSFIPIQDSDTTNTNNTTTTTSSNRARPPAHFTPSSQRTPALQHHHHQQQHQQDNAQMALNLNNNQFNTNPPPPHPPSNFPEDFTNPSSNNNTDTADRNVRIPQPATSSSVDSRLNLNPFSPPSSQQQNYFSGGGGSGGGGPPPMSTPNEGMGFQAIHHPHHQTPSPHIQPPPSSFQLPMSAQHNIYHYQQSNIAYQNAAHNFIHHPPPSHPPNSSDYYSHQHHHQQQQQQQLQQQQPQHQHQHQPPLRPHPPSIRPPPLHHHYHHHHHHLQQQQQQQQQQHHHQQQQHLNPYNNIYPQQHDNSIQPTSQPQQQQQPPQPSPSTMQHLVHPHHHPPTSSSQQQQQTRERHTSIPSYPKGSYQHFPPDSSSYPPPMHLQHHPGFDPASYYKTIPSDIYYSDMTTISAFHFGTETEHKGNNDHPENIASSSNLNSNTQEQTASTIVNTATTTTMNNNPVSFHGFGNNNNDKLSEAMITETANPYHYHGSNQQFPSHNDNQRNISTTTSSSSSASSFAMAGIDSTSKALNALSISDHKASNSNTISNPGTTTTGMQQGFPPPASFTSVTNSKSTTSSSSSTSSPSIVQSNPAISSQTPTTCSSSTTPTAIITTTHSNPLVTSKSVDHVSSTANTAAYGVNPVSRALSTGDDSNSNIQKNYSNSNTESNKTPAIPTVKISATTTIGSGNSVPRHILSPANPAPNSSMYPTSSNSNRVMIPGHTTSQPVSQSTGLLNQESREGTDCKDLREMLATLGLVKYLEKFEEQDVDLQVFLSLTDNDLKEVGIKLFGPRKKMANAIARWHSQAPIPSNCLEQAYADRLEGEMQELAIQLNQAYANEERLKAQVLQEQQLRSVTESCLMEVRGHWEKTRQMMEEAQGTMRTMGEALARLKLNQKETRRHLDGQAKSDHTSSSSTKSEGTATAACLDGPSSATTAAVELIRKSEKYLKEMHKGLSSLALNAEKVLKSTQDLSTLDKGLEDRVEPL